MRTHILNIRADANQNIGTGHIMRCIALGQAFKQKGGAVNFISDCHIKPLESRIKNEGFIFSKISSSREDKCGIEQTLSILKNWKTEKIEKLEKRFQWVVLDGYHFGENFQQSIKNNGFKLMVIDDYNHHLYYHGDILLNQNIGAENFEYNTDIDTIMLKGLKFALIREEFFGVKKPRPPVEKKSINILVTLGGSDPLNITATIVKALSRLKHTNVESKIIIGPANSKAPDLKACLNTDNRIELIENADMPDLMRWADFAVTAAGSTCMELCNAGIPFLSIVTADNQEALAKNFEKKGVSINMGWFSRTNEAKVAELLDSFIKNNHKREEMAQISKTLIDGQGAARVIRQMERIK